MCHLCGPHPEPVGPPEPGDDPLYEVTMNELDRRAGAVIGMVAEGKIAVITKHGLPVAFVVPTVSALEWLPPDLIMGPRGRKLSELYAQRAQRRARSELWHTRGAWDPATRGP